MQCAWQSFINLLPVWMRDQVDKQGKEQLQELRMRLNSPLQLVFSDRILKINRLVSSEDINYTVNMASRYSPWASTTAASGYITTQGGHRIGLCGTTVNAHGNVTNIQKLTSVCIRIARNFTGIAVNAWKLQGSILIIGAPGSGKTTFLRDLICTYSARNDDAICVVDERQEIFPQANGVFCFAPGEHTDVLSGCGKAFGIETVLRSMGPAIIAVDEITSAADCEAMVHAGWCGVRFWATAHASQKIDLLKRPIYRPILQSGLFQHLIVMHQDKTWHTEELE